MKRTALVTLVGSLLFAGCSPNSPKPTPSPIVIEVTFPAPTATARPPAPAPTPVVLVGELTESSTYTNSLLGFSFDYPSTWGLSALPELAYAAITFYSWDPNTLPPKQQEGIPEGGEKMDVIAMEDVNLEQALESLRNQAKESGSRVIASEEVVTLPSGAPGVLIRYESVENEPELYALATEINGEAIILYGVGWSLDYFMSIAYTFRPAGQ